MQNIYKLVISVFLAGLVVVSVLEISYRLKLRKERISSPDTEQSEISPTDEFTTRYVVRSGDTLGKIAARYKQTDTLEQIIKRNKITNPDKLSIGQELLISTVKISSTNAPPAGSGK